MSVHPSGSGPDRISMEPPKRWKKLKLRESFSGSEAERPTACSDMHRNWPTLSSKRLKGKQAATTVKVAPATRSKRWRIGVLKRPATTVKAAPSSSSCQPRPSSANVSSPSSSRQPRPSSANVYLAELQCGIFMTTDDGATDEPPDDGATDDQAATDGRVSNRLYRKRR